MMHCSTHSTFFSSLLAVLVALALGNSKFAASTPAAAPVSNDGSGLAAPPRPQVFPVDDEDILRGAVDSRSASGAGGPPLPSLAPLDSSGVSVSVGVDASGDYGPPLRPGVDAGSWNGTSGGVINLPLWPPAGGSTPSPPSLNSPAAPTQPGAGVSSQARSCTSQSSQTLEASRGYRYRPICQPRAPSLFQPQQCSPGACFCVDQVTGAMTPGTAVPVLWELACTPLTFAVTLGFSANWHESMAQTSTVSFHECASRIENELDRLFVGYQGSQKAGVLRLRSGSIIADIRLTSVGHPPSLEANVQELKRILDNKLAAGTFAGMDVIPKYYSFQQQGNANRDKPGDIGDSNVTDSSGRAASKNPTRTHGGEHGDTNNNNNNGRSRSDSNDKNAGAGDSNGNNGGGNGHQLASAGSSVDSLFTSPGVLAAIVAGGIGLILLVVLLGLFCAYRARKAGEGSYKVNGGAANGAGKKDSASASVQGRRNGGDYARTPSKEFYA